MGDTPIGRPLRMYRHAFVFYHAPVYNTSSIYVESVFFTRRCSGSDRVW